MKSTQIQSIRTASQRDDAKNRKNDSEWRSWWASNSSTNFSSTLKALIVCKPWRVALRWENTGLRAEIWKYTITSRPLGVHKEADRLFWVNKEAHRLLKVNRATLDMKNTGIWKYHDSNNIEKVNLQKIYKTSIPKIVNNIW